MNDPQNPLPGAAPSAEWISFALNVAEVLYRDTGLGLQLFNALRARFPTVARATLGEITTTFGRGTREAFAISQGDPNAPIDVQDLPVVPASWHESESGDRIIMGIEVEADVSSGPGAPTWMVWVTGLEIATPEEFMAAAESQYMTNLRRYNPEMADAVEDQRSKIRFIGKFF